MLRVIIISDLILRMFMPSVVMLSVIMLADIMLRIVLPSVVVLSAIILIVVVQNVVAPISGHSLLHQMVFVPVEWNCAY